MTNEPARSTEDIDAAFMSLQGHESPDAAPTKRIRTVEEASEDFLRLRQASPDED